ncbi:phage holin family protein [Salimicrobium halophilum]|uniref:Putative membrane protein n=1 Tax=Salimicrobium halophilum TaxID=86666 RepID=A0A1G8V4Z4_9BACI|nr:phage holin family protein [Salimicrobium halophilum]SDJ61059.1 putative membrane protein [Salimicrobium halophilum]
MKNALLHVIVNAIALLVVSVLFDSIQIDGVTGALFAALILSILNAVIKPILVVLTLPVTILSLGLFLFVINAITLLLTDAILGSTFEIGGFGVAILAAVIIAIVNLVLNKLIQDI